MAWTPGLPVLLRTSRYLIRSARSGDVDAEYLSWFKDPETMQFVGPDLGRLSSDEHHAVVASADHRKRMLLLVLDAAEGRKIGWMRAQLEPQHKRAQTSIVIGDHSHRRRGAMVEVHRAVRQFLFSEADVQKITFITYGSHAVMLAYLATNPDIVKEGVLKRHDWVPGVGWQDAHMFAIFRDPPGGD
jgi:RimJ/RimL family protein N-acetyltransferase